MYPYLYSNRGSRVKRLNSYGLLDKFDISSHYDYSYCMDDINFDIAATVILILNIFFFYYKKTLQSQQNRLFARWLKISLVSTLLEISGVLMNRHPETWPLPVLISINSMFYLCQNSIPFLFLLYILVLTGKINFMNKQERALLIFPWAISMLLILTNPATRFIFFFSFENTIHRGSYVPLLYVIALFFALYSIYCTYRFRKALPEHTTGAVFFFVLVSLLPGISQLFLLLTVQNPEVYIDSAIGVLNRNGFATQVKLFLENKVTFYVALIAVEDIGFVRHTFGYDFFLKLIKKIAYYLSKSIPLDCIVSSPGEAQFALIVKKNDTEDNTQELNRGIQERFRHPWVIEDNPIKLSVRVCLIHCPEETSDISEIFRCLDQLATASFPYMKGKPLMMKDLGLADKKREAAIERAIKRAIEHKSFIVYYQPIFSIREQKIVSAEALVRLNDEDLGFIPPDEFIPISERNGTIQKIGTFVLDAACAFMSKQAQLKNGIKFIEINLSVAQCIQPDLPVQVNGVTARYQITPSQICFEVTETAAATSPEKLIQNLKSLADSGFSIALDDYGTGYSNIQYLMDLPFKYAKLDRSMVSAWAESEKGKITMESTISMFRKMNLRIIAEGIETAEQARLMATFGCDYIQGYFYSKPVPEKDFLVLLDKAWGEDD